MKKSTCYNIQIASFLFLLLVYIYAICVFSAFDIYKPPTTTTRTGTVYTASSTSAAKGYQSLAILATILGAFGLIGFATSLVVDHDQKTWPV